MEDLTSIHKTIFFTPNNIVMDDLIVFQYLCSNTLRDIKYVEIGSTSHLICNYIRNSYD